MRLEARADADFYEGSYRMRQCQCPATPSRWLRQAGQAATDLSDWVRNVVKISDPNKPFYSHGHTAISYLSNTRGPDGSPVVKEDVDRYLTGHARNGAHAGYGKQ
jgi:hypothetical protein